MIECRKMTMMVSITPEKTLIFSEKHIYLLILLVKDDDSFNVKTHKQTIYDRYVFGKYRDR